MLFTQSIFLFYFLPAALILHRFALSFNRGQEYGFLARAAFIILTIIFYGCKQPWWLVPFFLCVGFDIFWCYFLCRAKSEKARAIILGLAVAQNLSLLIFFKYWAFLLSAFGNLIPQTLRAWPSIISGDPSNTLPPGISFYVFESLSFLIDLYRDPSKKMPRVRDLLGFLAMFPRFTAGPIVRFRDLAHQFDRYRGMQLEAGLFLAILGLFLKVCFGDNFAHLIYYAFAKPIPNFAMAWIGVVSYTLQVYFDFAGYSLIAIGIGKCFGFQFPTNFNTPLLSRSLNEYWQRWHMSLGAWLKDYFFNPLALAASRRSPKLLYAVTFFTMVLCGLWHGAGINFVIWGAWHGFFLCIERYFRFEKRLPRSLHRSFTLAVVFFGVVIYRAESFERAKIIASAMVNPFTGLTINTDAFFQNGVASLFAIVGVIYCFFIEKRVAPAKLELLETISLKQAVLGIVLFAIAIIWGLSASDIPFLYHQF
jgi:alginate O-acetyltransferase complex protein AlgI